MYLIVLGLFWIVGGAIVAPDDIAFNGALGIIAIVAGVSHRGPRSRLKPPDP